RIELLDSLDGCVIGLGDKLVLETKGESTLKGKVLTRFNSAKIMINSGVVDAYDTDRNIEMWKIKKLIRALESARVNGTSMISLILTHRDQISRVAQMLGDEYGTASNIKSRVNRQSVLAVITSAQQRLKLYSKIPTSGLVLYTGNIFTEDGKEKKVTIDLEPFKPVNASFYLCDNKFHCHGW
ncbi:hypothetical protein HPP92_013313, partial [Vanilla planifolia]